MGTRGKEVQRALRAQIRAEIGRAGLRPADIARKAGMHTSTLSRYLNDAEDRGLPYNILNDIAEALGLPVNELIVRAERSLSGNGS
jgi:transcriptional regulator with XRE-family HTH domain